MAIIINESDMLVSPDSNQTDEEFVRSFIEDEISISKPSPLRDQDVVVQSPGNCIFASVATGMKIVDKSLGKSEADVINDIEGRTGAPVTGGIREIGFFCEVNPSIAHAYIGDVKDVVDYLNKGGAVVYGEGHAKTIGGYIKQGGKLMFTVHDSGRGRQRTQDLDALGVVNQFQPIGEKGPNGYGASAAVALFPRDYSDDVVIVE